MRAFENDNDNVITMENNMNYNREGSMMETQLLWMDFDKWLKNPLMDIIRMDFD